MQAPYRLTLRYNLPDQVQRACQSHTELIIADPARPQTFTAELNHGLQLLIIEHEPRSTKPRPTAPRSTELRPTTIYNWPAPWPRTNYSDQQWPATRLYNDCARNTQSLIRSEALRCKRRGRHRQRQTQTQQSSHRLLQYRTEHLIITTSIVQC